MMIAGLLVAGVVAQQPSPRDSLREHLYVQAELTWYGSGPAHDLSNRLVRIAAIRRLGIGGTRVPVEWARIEAVRGQREWSRLDSTVAELEANGLAAYGVIAYSPSWAVPETLRRWPRIDSHRPVVDGSSARGDTAFAAFAAAAARRYRRQIDQWEIWNEENNPAFWMHSSKRGNRGPDPADYATLYALARDSIMAANPQAEVAIGGLASFGGESKVVSDPLDSAMRVQAVAPHEYLRALLAYVRPSAVAIHPYSAVAPGVLRPKSSTTVFPGMVVDSVLDVLNHSGLGSAPVWVTEWGVNAVPGLSQEAVDAWYRDALTDLICRDRVKFVTIQTLVEANHFEHYALLTPGGSLTLDGVALQHTVAHWVGCAQR